ncbi:MAG: amidohydrolase family protein [Candidatus Dormibacteraeota bacterium]|nr:amidohydrolase family protein [Candidatus Dormibacteraeota bacterium]
MAVREGGGRAVIDCDVHDEVPGVQALFPYLAPHWVEYCRQSAFHGPVDTAYPPRAPTTVSPLWRGAEPRAASSVDAVQGQLLDPLGVDLAILTCTYAVESIHNPDTAAAMAAAVNDWQRVEWLDRESRLRASIVVPSQQPEMAAAEIERVAADRRFVQVVVPVRSSMPYGNRHFHPLFEAAARHGLVVALHFGGAPGNPPTGAGWPSYYLEDLVGMAQIFQSQLLSLIAEGTFDRFQELRVACVEGGFTWVPALLWRLDKEWKGLRRDVPWVRRPPSAYIRERVRFTTQPLDPPPGSGALAELLAETDLAELLLFATDYPHWHFDSLEQAVPAELPVARLDANARAFYPRLEAVKEAVP